MRKSDRRMEMKSQNVKFQPINIRTLSTHKQDKIALLKKRVELANIASSDMDN